MDGIYLHFDYVHLLKNIRKSWIPEKTLQLQFEYDGKLMIANIQHLKQLFLSEEGHTLKMSELDKVSEYPKPLERQRVSTFKGLPRKNYSGIEAIREFPYFERFLYCHPHHNGT